uniref:DDE Tnp4 domain-containing protein n=1 Tax=Heliothis virescens TaxID=7102 RepID=A0A2A4JV88_HELVI
MAEKPPEEGYISVVDDEPEIFELLKWDTSHTQKPEQPPRPIEKPRSPEKRVLKPAECDPFDLNEPSFIETYRLSKDLTRDLCEELKPVMPDSTKSIEFSVESKVLAALAFYASGKYQKTIGGRGDPSATQYFVSTAVLQVTEAMNHPTIVKKYIHFPHLRQERDIIKAKFYMKYGIPNVVGCVDCTHVPMARPDDDQKSHFNKSYHSKKVQIVLAALAFYASGKYQKTIGGRGDPSATQYFVSTAVLQVTEAMNHPTIVKKYIHFPHLRQERDIIKAKFYMKYGIPNVVGCVDCTHVPMARPDDDQKSHFNKSYHSKKVQIICDSDSTILSVDATAGGSYSHDNILSRHAVRVDMDSLNHSGEPCWLIGGPHYTQKTYVMTPIPKITKKSPVSPEKYYSNIHAQTHGAVVETIKQLKTRWKCLQANSNKQFDPPTVAMMIVACCVLHNICNRRGLPIVPMNQTEERLEAMKQKVANGPIPRKQVEDVNGIQARARLVERLWNERRIAPECAPKKRMSKKDRILESHQTEMRHQMQPPQQMNHPPQQLHQNHHEDMSKRPRIISMTTPTYSLGVPPGWGHYPQH